MDENEMEYLLGAILHYTVIILKWEEHRRGRGSFEEN